MPVNDRIVRQTLCETGFPFHFNSDPFKIPYEMYTLPKSSERGQPFVDFNEVLKSIIPKKVKTVMKRRKKKNE